MTSPHELFEGVTNRETLYEQGTIILGLDHTKLVGAQLYFYHCYNLWLALGNGFSGIFDGDTFMESLPIGVSGFDAIGLTSISSAGNEALAAFVDAGINVGDVDIVDAYYQLDQRVSTDLHNRLRELDDRAMPAIWKDPEVEPSLIRLAAQAASTNPDAEFDT